MISYKINDTFTVTHENGFYELIKNGSDLLGDNDLGDFLKTIAEHLGLKLSLQICETIMTKIENKYR